MFSFKELFDCDWKMDEDTTENNQHYPLMFTSGTLVKQEKGESFSQAIYHHTAQLPQDPNPYTDPLGCIKITNVCGSLPEDFYEEFSENQIDRRFVQLPPMTEVGTRIQERIFRSMYPVEIEEIVSEDEDGPVSHVTCKAKLPLYHLSNQMQTTSFQMQGIENSAALAVYQPLYNYSGGYRPRGYQQDSQQLIHVPISNADPSNYSCPARCPCVCHVSSSNVSSNLAVFDEENQRPCVIMAPVNRGNEATSIVTHVPLQIDGHLFNPSGISTERRTNQMNEDDPDSDDSEGEKYFRQAMNGKLTRFKLAKEDWDKIPLSTFPSGGRLLGGDWTRIFSIKVKNSNPWCDLRFKNNHVRSANSRKRHSAPFFRGAGECRRPECGLRIAFVIQEERGKYVDVKYIGNIFHKVQA